MSSQSFDLVADQDNEVIAGSFSEETGTEVAAAFFAIEPVAVSEKCFKGGWEINLAKAQRNGSLAPQTCSGEFDPGM